MARLGPSGLAQLFREIANYVSTRLSNYNTKAELGSLLDTKADDNNVVHTCGDETIEGVKTFTTSPFVSNYAVTNGFFTKHNSIARNEVPSQIYHSAFRVFDKNAKTLGEYCVEKSTSGSSLLHMDVHTEDSEGNDIMESLYLNLSNDGNSVSFHPIKNNRTDLGMAHYKWANAYIDRVVCTRFTHSVNNGSVYITGGSEYDKGATLALHGEESSDAGSFVISSRDKTRSLYLVGKPDGTLQWAGQDIALDGNVVHTSGDEYINGTKMFSNTIHSYADLTTSGDAQVYRFDDTNDNPCGHIYNNVHWHDNAISNGPGAYNAKSGKTMEIEITSNDAGVGMAYVAGSTSKGNVETVTSATGHTGIATMGWVNNPATSTNVVHRTGNETIDGVKSFNKLMYIYDNMSNKNSQMDLFTTPANTLFSHYMFVDKNDEVSAYMQYGQTNTGTDFIGLFIHDKNRTLHGIQVTSNNYVIPFTNNAYSLGSVSNKWANVYSNRVSFPSEYYITTDTNDNSLRIIRDGSNHGNNYKVIIQGDTGKFFAPNGFIGNLQGNADTATSATYATTQATSDNSTKIATTAYVKSQGYVTLTSLAGGNSAGSLNHSVGSLVLASCSGTAFASTKSYANVAGLQLYPCRTEIYTMYNATGYHYEPIVVRYSTEMNLGSGTWRYLGGSGASINNSAGEIFGMFLRVA